MAQLSFRDPRRQNENVPLHRQVIHDHLAVSNHPAVSNPKTMYTRSTFAKKRRFFFSRVTLTLLDRQQLRTCVRLLDQTPYVTLNDAKREKAPNSHKSYGPTFLHNAHARRSFFSEREKGERWTHIRKTCAQAQPAPKCAAKWCTSSSTTYCTSQCKLRDIKCVKSQHQAG